MIGKIIGGRYQIIKHLGGGGFSSTFVALDIHLPDKPQCVVKQLKPKSKEKSILQVARRLFHQEAEVLYKLGTTENFASLEISLGKNAETLTCYCIWQNREKRNQK